MNDGVQLVNPWPPLIEGNFSQTGAVDAGVAIENVLPEPAHDFLVNRFARTHEIVRDLVGINCVRAQLRKHFADQGFAGGDTACESNFEQFFLSPSKSFNHRGHREHTGKACRMLCAPLWPLWLVFSSKPSAVPA